METIAMFFSSRETRYLVAGIVLLILAILFYLGERSERCEAKTRVICFVFFIFSFYIGGMYLMKWRFSADEHKEPEKAACCCHCYEISQEHNSPQFPDQTEKEER